MRRKKDTKELCEFNLDYAAKEYGIANIEGIPETTKRLMQKLC